MKKTIIILSFLMFTLLISFIGIIYFNFFSQKVDDTFVPNIVGLNEVEVKEILDKNSLRTITRIYQSKEEKGKVIDVFPKEGTLVKEKSDVIIYISTGDNEFIMPDFINMEYELMIEEINDIKEEMNIGFVIIEEESQNHPKNTIFNQLPKAKEVLKENTNIIIYVSSGAKTVIIPNMVGWELSTVERFSLENSIYFEYFFVDSAYAKNTVVSQTLTGEIIITKQNKIGIYISKGLDDYIPDFIGLELDVALMLAKIFDIDIEYEYVKSNEKINRVIKQDLAVGSFNSVLLYVAK